MRNPRWALGALCLTVFVDLLGFGIILPLLPYAAEDFGASDAGVGLLFAAYSLAQLVAAPALGAASDRFGRKPLLLLALTGSVISLAATAAADSLAALLVARAVAGACGGSIGVAHAFAADLAPPEERARVLGAVGASVGLGFVAGPALGALLADHGLAGASLAAAGVAAAALLLAALALPHTRPAPRITPGGGRGGTTSAGARGLLVAGFAATAAFTAMEATLALLAADRHDVTAAGLGWLLAAAGLVLAAVQGLLIGPLTRVLTSRALAATGLILLGAGLALLPLLPGIPAALALLVLSAGYGLTTPTLATLLTTTVPPDRIGMAMGAAQSATALARALAPAAAGAAYDLGPVWPYTGGAVLAAVATVIVLRRSVRLPTPAEHGHTARVDR
jgi:predicted MFS family arabinose efflux permease